jgi:CheY-specific phosphatase CheX
MTLATIPAKIVIDETVYQEFHDLLVVSVKEIFQSLCNAKMEAQAKLHVQKKEHAPNIDLAAVLSLSSTSIFGNMALGYPKDTFIKLASAAMGEDFKEISADNADFGAEILNMVFGSLKRKFNANRNADLQPSIPVVIRGQGLETTLSPDAPTWLVTFSSGMGLVHATFSLRSNIAK